MTELRERNKTWGAIRWARSFSSVLAPCLLYALSPADAHSEDLSKITIPETHTVQTLDPAGSERLYVLDMVFSHPIAGKAFVFDGLSQKVLGTITAGYMPSLVIEPGHKELVVLGTFWSRGAHGDRTDVAAIYDASTLSPIAEVVLPPGRFLIADKSHNVDLTTDGRYLLVTNMAPATSVTVVDLPQRRVVGTIETPGCMFVFPSGVNRFSSICADGALFTATFGADGKAQPARSPAFFDARKDPVFEHAGLDRRANVAHFITYEGQIHSVDLSSAVPQFRPPWSVTTEKEHRKNWKPGGWKLIAYHQPSNRLFVLMHRGGAWTHKKPGSEVWIFDVAGQKKVGRIKLKKPASSITVSQDATAPRLYAIEGDELATYDVQGGRHVGTVKQMGDTALELITYDR